MERRKPRRHAAGMSQIDALVVGFIFIVLVVLGISSWRDYAERTAGLDCENEAPQLAKFSDLPLAACPAPRAATAAAPRPAAKVDRARLAGEISDSWPESLTLSFDGGDAVLVKRSSWLNRLVSVPFMLVASLLMAAALAAFLVSMGAGLINLVARLLRPAPGAGVNPQLITNDRVGTAIVWVAIAIGIVAFGIVLVSAARTDTIRISPAQARIAASSSAFGFGLATPMSRSYHAIAPISDKKGRTFLKVYTRDGSGRLASVYRFRMRDDRVALAELLKPAGPAR